MQLTDEQQEEVPDEELPENPIEQLKNKLTYSKMIHLYGILHKFSVFFHAVALFFCLIYLTNNKNYCIIKLSIISLKGEFL
ncbi:MAG: hypothetical protein K2J88_06320 [Oscillospiraceae bacterium]|nr:hypothetical protein [Oscillospiraceae bacterium]